MKTNTLAGLFLFTLIANTSYADRFIEGATTPALSINNNQLIVSYQSERGNKTSLVVHNLSTDRQQTIAQGDNWFVNWADFPKIATNDHHWVTWYLQHSSDGQYAYDIMLIQSFDSGNTWTDAIKLHNDNTNTEHGFASIVSHDQRFTIAWLDGRHTQSTGHQHHSGSGAMTVRSATINSDGTISDRLELDAKTCDCCQTAIFRHEGESLVAYRDRSDEEIRDTSITRSAPNASPEQWSEDDWQINGCPVNGPTGFSLERPYVVSYTAANSRGDVYITDPSGRRVLLSSNSIGRLDSVVYNDIAYISFIETQDDDTFVKVVAFDGETATSLPERISLGRSRASGFPQIEALNGQLVIATTTSEGVRLTYIDL